ncbi:adenylosuccinate synthetase [Bizionia algoritergicola]|uniref:Adenylosuccinate synthetase n=1 Tax=Bizionia algoritergicola TaxID=291187 RepID=A0A5D0QWK2_9FLAO|nr:adenylosuccinate synthetase [Bizionia sp. APA-3]OBX24079.1 adenylosuccinate synthetase [Bizionia sp. APA-3]TYB73587.1 adenylosuccinate synthetase [Bizionia algoritergicola]
MLNILLLLPQIPSQSQNPGESGTIDLSQPFDLIVYIILPIFFIIIYFLWKRMKKRDENKH